MQSRSDLDPDDGADARRQSSVDKTLGILMALGELGLKSTAGVRLADLVRHAGHPRPTVHRLLGELRRFGFAEQDEATGRYRLGPKILLLSAQCLGGLDLRRVAQPILRELVDEIGHTAHLGVRDGHNVIYIDKTETSRGVRLASTLGQQREVTATGLGKAILAFTPAPIVADLLSASLPRRTPGTITDPVLFREHLQGVRAGGIAFDDEECDVGIRCTAAPIIDHTGYAVAAISVSTLAAQVPWQELERLGARVAAAAGRVTATLGGIDHGGPRTTAAGGWHPRRGTRATPA